LRNRDAIRRVEAGARLLRVAIVGGWIRLTTDKTVRIIGLAQ
jgi:hypothetical protein